MTVISSFNYYLLPEFTPARPQDLVLWYEPTSFRGNTWCNLAPYYNDKNHGTAFGDIGLYSWHPLFPPALEFYGSGEYFRVGYHPSIDFWYRPFSIEAVIKTDYKSDYQGIIFH